MQQSAVPRAAWARHLDVLGHRIGAAAAVSLEAEELLRTASQQTGLSDFGDDRFREPFAILVRSLDQEAQLTLTGRLIARAELCRILQSRLRIVETEKRHPEIQQQRIERPIFIIGMGRTGSSILHEYLMHDPRQRAPLAWEMKFPSPPVPPDADPPERIEWNEAETQIMYEIDASLITKHEAHSRLPEECSQLMAHEFLSGHFFSRNHVPSYAAFNARADVRPALEMHKRILKILQWRGGTTRWVLKYGGHAGKLPELLEIYPDAKVIHTHRDPAVVVRSFISLIASLRLMRSDAFDAAAASEMLNAGMARNLEKVIDEREKGLIPRDQIADVHFDDLMRDALGEIARVYAHLGLEFTPEARDAIEGYIWARPRTKHGEHVYAFSDVVDLRRERERYARYVEYYGIEREA